MAVGNWTFFPRWRKNMGNAGFAAGALTGHVKMLLYTSAAVLSAKTPVSCYFSLGTTNEVASTNDYGHGGKLCSTATWLSALSINNMRFTINSKSFKGSSGAINNIRYAVLVTSGASTKANKLICWSALSTAQFNLASGNTLTVSPAATGVFNLT